MNGHRTVWKEAQRWLLTLLCLAASLAYLIRQTEPSSLSDPRISAAMSTDQMSGMAMQMPVQGTSPVQASRGQHAHAALATSRPSAPSAPGDHAHAGHCPFCFTAAFALEADRVVLPVNFSEAFHQDLPDEPRPAPLPVGHADARAPPV